MFDEVIIKILIVLVVIMCILAVVMSALMLLAVVQTPVLSDCGDICRGA